MKSETVPIDTLTLDPRNTRVHDERNISTIAASLKRFGQVKPIVVDQKGLVVAGNGTVEAARSLGWTEVAAVRTKLKGAEASAYAIADNRTAELATWDEPALSIMLKELREDIEIEETVTGFSIKEIDEYLMPTEVVEDEVPEPPDDPITKPGDLWIMGEHRVLCGDATKDEDVERLMGQARASLVVTDPPYLVDYDGGRHPQSWTNSPTAKDKHWDTYKDQAAATDFYGAFIRVAIRRATCERAAWYQWYASLRAPEVHDAWRAVGLLTHSVIVWVKTRPVLTHSRYMWQHELCVYGWLKGKQPAMKPPANARTVWEFHQKNTKSDHPCEKPIGLIAVSIEHQSKRGAVIYDPFLGSGTTLIAAEQLGRKCYGLEIEPRYVDVIVKRWEKLTGQKATLAK